MKTGKDKLSSFKLNGQTKINIQNKNAPPPITIFKRKEKVLHFKWASFLVLTHVLRTLLFWEPPAHLEEKIIPVSANHQLLNIPVLNFTSTPPIGQKKEVSLFNEKDKRSVRGYLRSIVKDPLGPTGIKAELEIKSNDLFLFRKAKAPWQIYPTMNEVKAKKRSKVYEINL